MGNYRFYLLLVVSFVVSVKAQAEAVVPDYYSLESVFDGLKEQETNIQNDEIIHDDDAVDTDVAEGHEYNIDQVINSAFAEGLDVENVDSKIDDSIQTADNEVQDDNIVNSDEAKVKEEIESFRKQLDGEVEFENVEVDNEEDVDGTLDDYQFEDNRSEAKEEPRNDLPSDSDGSFENQVAVDEPVEQEARNDFPDPSMENQETIEKTRDILSEDDRNNDFADGVQNNDEENSDQIIEEHNDMDESVEEAIPIEDTPKEEEQNLVNDDLNADQVAVGDEPHAEEIVPHDEFNPDYENFDYEGEQESFVDYIDGALIEKKDENMVREEESAENPVELNDEEQLDTNLNEDVKEYEETEDIIDNVQSNLEDTVDKVQADIEDTVNKVQDDVEDTVEKVQADLDKNLQHLFDTWNKLSQDSAEIPANEEKAEPINVAEYEQKYGKPYGEDTVLSQRDYDYGNDEEQVAEETNGDNESNLKDISVENAQSMDEESKVEMNIPETNVEPNEPEINEESQNQETLIEDAAVDGIMPLNTGDNDLNAEMKNEDVAEVQNNGDESRQIDQEPPVEIDGQEIVKNRSLIDNINQDEQIFEETDAEQNQESKNLALENETPESEETKTLDEKQIENEYTTENVIQEKTLQKSIKVSELTSSQYDALMQQFATVHSSDMDPQSEDFAKHVAPVHITLSVDEPTVVTSPDYPDNYPTNNIVDWIFDGEGVGIEFNVTDLELNGVLGDYLLVKPGSLDESGAEGLIFSYKLTEPRQYRFLDVNRMFVRFRSNPAVEGSKGFSFSVKMVAAIPEEEPLPDPEPLHPPHSTLTVYLGVTLAEFQEIREPFRQIVADMATMYINSNGLDLGANSTSEVTRITAAAPCNVEWPSSRRCVQVTFGVPLTLDGDLMMLSQEQLSDMWTTFLYVDPFAIRMRSLGVEEFAPPNEAAVLTSWLVIGVAVTISAAMLAFALWRYSCFEDYTRMSPYSDTDSICAEKRDLDLYPTPHQTLPPLYSDEYRWVDDDSTRVDMGAFTNRSFTRDDLFAGESDEEGSVPRDRYTSDV